MSLGFTRPNYLKRIIRILVFHLIAMKHLITCLALGIACAAGAQNFIHEYPWNPDWDNDNFVGSSDLTGFLSAFGSEFGNPPEPCDYDGTPLEEWAANWINGDIVVDSIFVEYEIEDVSSYFIAGCPEEITDTLIVANSHLLTIPNNYHATSLGTAWGGAQVRLTLNFGGSSGMFNWNFENSLLSEFTSDGFFGGSSTTGNEPIPFPSEWTLTEDGISLIWTNGWATYANYLHILPYWHYAE